MMSLEGTCSVNQNVSVYVLFSGLCVFSFNMKKADYFENPKNVDICSYFLHLV